VAKLSPKGTFLWVIAARGVGNVSGSGVALDSKGNVYVTGAFVSQAAFGAISVSAANKGAWETFVAKLRPDGRFAWVVTAAGKPGGNHGSSVSVDAADNVYVTGSFRDQVTLGKTTFTSKGPPNTDDLFVARITPAGKIRWARSGGGKGWDDGADIQIDRGGNVHVAGSSNGQASFGSYTLSPSAGKLHAPLSDLFVARLSPQGAFSGLLSSGTLSQISAHALAIDGAGGVYLTGDFYGQAYFGATTLSSQGSADLFIARLSAAGKPQWARAAGFRGIDAGYDIALDAGGNSYVTGTFQGTAGFGSTTLTSRGHNDLFVARLSPKGTFLWATSAGGATPDAGHAVAVDAAGALHVVGDFSGKARFGARQLTSAGGSDLFVWKLLPP
jgi:hypothetical protein